MNINEAKQILQENNYIIEKKNILVDNIIDYYEKHIGTDNLDKNYVQRNWKVWCGYIPDVQTRRDIKTELIKRGYNVETMFYTDEVNRLVIYGKIDKNKMDAIKKIDKLMSDASIKDINELKKYLELLKNRI